MYFARPYDENWKEKILLKFVVMGVNDHSSIGDEVLNCYDVQKCQKCKD
jgi:hypothetical protein